MLYLDQVHFNAAFKSMRLYNSFFLSMREVRFKSVLYEYWIQLLMTISILLSFCRTLPNICEHYLAMYCILLGVYAISEDLAFVVRAFMRVCLCSHVSQWGIACMLVIVLVKTNPLSVKADYGPDGR